MFYFLEGAEAVPLCRSCLIRQERERALRATDSPEMVRAAVAALSPAAGTAEPPAPGADLAAAVRRYLAEELDRIAVAIERMSEEDPGARLARQLQQKALGDIAQDRLADAVLEIGDLRRNLTSFDPAFGPTGPLPPWDESVDELFERVTARARALARPPPAARLDPEGSPAFDLAQPQPPGSPAEPS
jgi:hypothetical protein